MSEWLLGVDLGQSQDFTAIVIIEKTVPTLARLLPARAGTNHYTVRHLERPKLGTHYPEIVARVKALMAEKPLAGNVTTLIDQTGVGRAVGDMFAAAQVPVKRVSIHGGDQVTFLGHDIRVPKRDLVAAMSVCFQTDRLHIAPRLTLAPILAKELLNFRVKIDPATAHDSYSAWRDSIHDDLVLATALCVFQGERGHGFTPYVAGTRLREMNPLQVGDDPYTHALLGSVTVKGPSSEAFDWMEYRSDRAGGSNE